MVQCLILVILLDLRWLTGGVFGGHPLLSPPKYLTLISRNTLHYTYLNWVPNACTFSAPQQSPVDNPCDNLLLIIKHLRSDRVLTGFLAAIPHFSSHLYCFQEPTLGCLAIIWGPYPGDPRFSTPIFHFQPFTFWAATSGHAPSPPFLSNLVT
jgi:hypothetical protein